MKRLIVTLTAITGFIVFTACENSAAPSANAEQKLNGVFSTDMTLELDDFTAEGVLTRYDSGIWNACFESPSELSGVQLNFNGDSVEASYKGLSFSVPQAAVAESDDISGSKKDDLIEIEGELDGEKYTLYLNGDGSLAEFRMNNMGGCIIFEGYSPDAAVTTTETTIESLIVTTSLTAADENAQQ